MYYHIYTSDDTNPLLITGNDNDKYTDNEKTELTTSNPEEHICIVCFTSTEPILLLRDHPEYIMICECNTHIHGFCLKEWFNKTHSCPICRKKLWYNEIRNNNIMHTIVCVYSQTVIWILRILYVFNVIFIMYSIYFIYHISY